MFELLKMLRKLNNGEYVCGKRFPNLMIDMINYYSEKGQPIDLNDDNFIREYLRFNNMYTSEEEFEFIKRDLFTEYLEPDTMGFYILLKQKLMEFLYNDNYTIKSENMKVLNSLGFKCYPVTYNIKGCVLGVMTNYGTIVLYPFKKGE